MDHETADEIKRHFNVVAESLRSDIRTLAEGVGGTNDRLDRVETRLDRVETRLDGVETRLDRVETRLAEFETRTMAEFSETRAVIRFSFGELDRRIQSLEPTSPEL